tara:strand:+ start:4460 stop:4660 length:201 start_codon:yes stop_codon:yes gene_type:complete
MNKENVESEIERLTKDKLQIETSIVTYEKELIKLKAQNDMLTGALQTCNYFLTQYDDEVKEETDSV